MIAVVQRVTEARVDIDGACCSSIGAGSLVLLGVEQEDGQKEVDYLARKLVELRIFRDDDGKMNRSLKEVGGEVLVVSQFTLVGDTRKGRRPSFLKAADPETAEALYEAFVSAVKKEGVSVGTGRFAAMMEVHLVNDGPVTLILKCRNGQPVEV